MNSPIAALLLLLLLVFFPSETLENEIIQGQQPPLHHQLIPPSTAPYWVKIKALFTQAQSYLFPPNLEGSRYESAGSGIEGGAGDKVKVAVAKSLGEGKATVEGSAKSAANMAKEKMHQTAQRLKETLSSPAPADHEPQEL